MAFWFITASIFRHSIITFSLKRSKRGMASILIGSRSIPFLGNRRHNPTVVRAGLWSLPRCLLWIEIVEFVTRNLTPWTITTEPADFFPKYTRWYLEAGENKHGSLKFHRKINLNIMAKTEQNLSYLLLRWVYIRFKSRQLINFFF